MKHKLVVVKEDDNRIAEKLSDHLRDRSYSNGDFQYDWKKIEFGDATINYVCYFNNKQIGFIPLDWEDNDLEMESFWANRGNATIFSIMTHIMERHLTSL